MVTSVDRDDLPDGGAGHFAATVRAIRDAAPGITVEVLQSPECEAEVKRYYERDSAATASFRSPTRPRLEL